MNHVVDTVKEVTNDQSVREQVVMDLVREITKNGYNVAPPQLAQKAYRSLKRITGVQDPWKEAKKQMNNTALALFQMMDNAVNNSPDPMESAVKLAIDGNMLDLGIHGHSLETPLESTIHESLARPLLGSHLSEFKRRVDRSSRILYLCDNAGEIVFDKLLIKRLPMENVTCVVRGAPVINDATMEDAKHVDLPEMVRVVDNGSDAPGCVIRECSSQFRELFASADLIISKGQGNFETISGEGKTVAYLLTAKCAVVARRLGRQIRDRVLQITP
jgi:hypothetical protein